MQLKEGEESRNLAPIQVDTRSVFMIAAGRGLGDSRAGSKALEDYKTLRKGTLVKGTVRGLDETQG